VAVNCLLVPGACDGRDALQRVHGHVGRPVWVRLLVFQVSPLGFNNDNNINNNDNDTTTTTTTTTITNNNNMYVIFPQWGNCKRSPFVKRLHLPWDLNPRPLDLQYGVLNN
jgi:hypothetical protein